VKKNGKEVLRQFRQIGILTLVPLILPLGPMIGYFIGHWIDLKFGISPYATFIFMTLGIVASVKEVIRMVRQALQE
jgi:ATP synthase protein I